MIHNESKTALQRELIKELETKFKLTLSVNSMKKFLRLTKEQLIDALNETRYYKSNSRRVWSYFNNEYRITLRWVK